MTVVWRSARTGRLRFRSVWGVRTSATTQDEHAWRAGQAAAAWIILAQAVLLVGPCVFIVATVRGGSTGYWSAVFIALIVVTFRPHWVNGWWLRLLTRPCVSVDGREASCCWAREISVDVGPGAVEVDTFIRYRGVQTPLGVGHLRVDPAPGQVVHVLARNGLTNGAPFRPSVAS